MSDHRTIQNQTGSEIAVHVVDPGTWPRRVDGKIVQDEPANQRRIATVAPGETFDVPREFDGYPVLVAIPAHALFGVTVFTRTDYGKIADKAIAEHTRPFNTCDQCAHDVDGCFVAQCTACRQKDMVRQ